MTVDCFLCYTFRIMAHVSLRMPPDMKIRCAEMAERFGYGDLSEFMRAMLLAFMDKYEGEEWESGLLYFSGDKVSRQPTIGSELADTYAFPVAAPARFWRYIKKISEGDPSDPQSEEW